VAEEALEELDDGLSELVKGGVRDKVLRRHSRSLTID
jgi:hypothetical protein